MVEDLPSAFFQLYGDIELGPYLFVERVLEGLNVIIDFYDVLLVFNLTSFEFMYC